jgi:hypothetical protein
MVYGEIVPLIGTFTELPMAVPLLANWMFTEGEPVPEAPVEHDTSTPATMAVKGKPKFIPLTKIGAESAVDM